MTRFLPPLNSVTFSVGTMTSPKYRSSPAIATRRSSPSRIDSSRLLCTLRMYQSMLSDLGSRLGRLRPPACRLLGRLGRLGRGGPRPRTGRRLGGGAARPAASAPTARSAAGSVGGRPQRRRLRNGVSAAPVRGDRPSAGWLPSPAACLGVGSHGCAAAPARRLSTPVAAATRRPVTPATSLGKSPNRFAWSSAGQLTLVDCS